MTVKLYGRPNAGSLCVEFLLDELGVAYRRMLVTGYGEAIQPPSYVEINPLREVPALTLEDGSLLTESAAIVLYLADAYPDAGLAPAIGTAARVPYLRWITYLGATIYPTAMRVIHPENYIADEAQFAAIKAKAGTALKRQWGVIDGALEAGGGHLVAGRLSAADIYTLMFALWFEGSRDVGKRPATSRLIATMKQRPAVAAALARNAARETWPS